MKPKTLYHGCAHKYQDEKFGDHMRAVNPTNKPGVFRCTVCGDTITTSKGLKKEEKKDA